MLLIKVVTCVLVINYPCGLHLESFLLSIPMYPVVKSCLALRRRCTILPGLTLTFLSFQFRTHLVLEVPFYPSSIVERQQNCAQTHDLSISNLSPCFDLLLSFALVQKHWRGLLKLTQCTLVKNISRW